jgi:hypothetical protein
MKNFLTLVLLHCTSIFLAQTSNNELLISQKTAGGAGMTSVDPLEILIFGNGGLKQTVTGNSNEDNPATGSLGASFIVKGRSEMTVGFTINKLNPTLISGSKDFGSNLLIPDLEGISFTLSGTRFFNDKIGIHGEILVANTKWEINSLEYSASPVALKLGGYLAPFGNLSRGPNFITLAFFAGYSNRSLIGNLTNEDSIRKQYFGTEKTSFHGLEIGANLILNKTKFFINIPVLLGDKIDNLTGGQVNIGVTISGDLLKL